MVLNRHFLTPLVAMQPLAGRSLVSSRVRLPRRTSENSTFLRSRVNKGIKKEQRRSGLRLSLGQPLAPGDLLRSVLGHATRIASTFFQRF